MLFLKIFKNYAINLHSIKTNAFVPLPKQIVSLKAKRFE